MPWLSNLPRSNIQLVVGNQHVTDARTLLETVDLDICISCFDGRTLHIQNPHGLIHRTACVKPHLARVLLELERFKTANVRLFAQHLLADSARALLSPVQMPVQMPSPVQMPVQMLSNFQGINLQQGLARARALPQPTSAHPATQSPFWALQTAHPATQYPLRALPSPVQMLSQLQTAHAAKQTKALINRWASCMRTSDTLSLPAILVGERDRANTGVQHRLCTQSRRIQKYERRGFRMYVAMEESVEAIVPLNLCHDLLQQGDLTTRYQGLCSRVTNSCSKCDQDLSQHLVEEGTQNWDWGWGWGWGCNGMSAPPLFAGCHVDFVLPHTVLALQEQQQQQLKTRMLTAKPFVPSIKSSDTPSAPHSVMMDPWREFPDHLPPSEPGAVVVVVDLCVHAPPCGSSHGSI